VRHAVAILLLGSATWVFAQDTGQTRAGSGTQPRAFGAASVKRNRSNGAGVPLIVAVRADRLIAPYTTVRELTRIAYGVDEAQVVGGPGWVTSDRFEVNATVPPGATRDEVREMLRALLADRFGLATHQEKQPLPTYALGYARADRRLGEQLRTTGTECRPIVAPAGLPAPPPPPPPPPGIGGAPPMILNRPAETDADGPRGLPCPSMFAPGHVSVRDFGFQEFLWQLAQFVRRPVVDRTGLHGRFDIDLVYTPDDQSALGRPSLAPADAPALATAIQEQLGLKLESVRAPVDVVVIDRVSPPTEN
jgi:uncharacterized protein (TIGR03435 family)